MKEKNLYKKKLCMKKKLFKKKLCIKKNYFRKKKKIISLKKKKNYYIGDFKNFGWQLII